MSAAKSGISLAALMPPPGFVPLNPGYALLPGLASLTRATSRKKERRRNAERRKGSGRATPADVATWGRFGRGARSKPERARLSAFHRGSRQTVVTLWLSSRPCFLGRSPHGRYPHFPIPVQGLNTHTGRSTGALMPKAARERVTSPRAGAALAPMARSVSRPRPSGQDSKRSLCIRNREKCQGKRSPGRRLISGKSCPTYCDISERPGDNMLARALLDAPR